MIQSISIALYYDERLEQITKKKQERVVINKDMPFILFLHTVFSSYPEMPKTYPPGSLGMLVNGKPPTDFSILKEGDIIELLTFLPTNKVNKIIN